MSVFRPDWLPDLKSAKGHAYYLYHSPDDRVCPFRMAKDAAEQLKDAGAAVTLAEYDGGHGWRGDVFADVKAGVEWLEKNARKK
jgi:predicted esterase